MYTPAKPRPRATATCLAARSVKNARPLSGPAAWLLDEREQLVGHDDARDRTTVERTCGRRREQVDVRERRDRQRLPPDPAQQLVVLARVVADLVDDEPRARRHLLRQLQVLRHDLPLVPLVVRHDAPQEEVRPTQRAVGPPLVVQAHVHLGEHAEEPDRVDVEDRRRMPLVAGHGIVARQTEDVAEPLGAELPAAALERVPVPVLARQVDDHLLAERQKVAPERVGREHRMPTRVVRDRQHVDPRVRRELARLRLERTAAVPRQKAAARDELRGDDERTGALEVLAKRAHLRPRPAGAAHRGGARARARSRARGRG